MSRRSTHRRVAALSLLCLAAVTAEARAATYCVADPVCVAAGGQNAGADLGAGIAAAAAHAGDDVVKIGPGTFTGPFAYSAPGDLQLTGSGDATVLHLPPGAASTTLLELNHAGVSSLRLAVGAGTGNTGRHRSRDPLMRRTTGARAAARLAGRATPAPGGSESILTWRSSMRLAVLAVPIAALLLAPAAGALPASAAAKTVEVGDNYFIEDLGVPKLVVRAGSAVTFNWVGKRRHNVTAGNPIPRKFRSPTQRRGSWSHRFKRKGTFDLICTVHGAGDMGMKVVVR